MFHESKYDLGGEMRISKKLLLVINKSVLDFAADICTFELCYLLSKWDIEELTRKFLYWIWKTNRFHCIQQ